MEKGDDFTGSEGVEGAVLLKPGQHRPTQLVVVTRGYGTVVRLKQLLQNEAVLRVLESRTRLECTRGFVTTYVLGLDWETGYDPELVVLECPSLNVLLEPSSVLFKPLLEET